MQAKLHRWAIEDSDRRFGDLFNLVCDPAFLVTAWQRVSTNKGARTAGIDKATAAWIETSIGVVAFLNQIRDSLKSGGFRPDEVRQVLIPKGNSGKFRVHSRGAGNWRQLMAGSGGSQGLPAMALAMASSAVMPWAAAESR